MLKKINVKTRSRVEFQDVTARIQDVVAGSGVRDGFCHVFGPHTTAGLLVNEHADPAVMEDIEAWLDAVVPQEGNYRHAEGNSPAHIKAGLMGGSRPFFVEEG